MGEDENGRGRKWRKRAKEGEINANYCETAQFTAKQCEIRPWANEKV